MREFSLRGVMLGALITLAFTAANVYLGLKVGLTFASAIPAAVISMALLYRFKDSNLLENNLVQTQASAAGTLSSVIFVLPALLMLGLWTGFPFWQTALICTAVIPPVLDLLYNAYGFAGSLPRAGMDPNQALAAPQATLMLKIASGIFEGSLDWSMLGLGLGLGVATGLVVIVADVLLRKSGRGALPPLAVGLGIYLPPTIGLTLTLGALLGWLIHRAVKAHAERGGQPWGAAAEERGLLLASGLIVGESLMGLIIAALIGFSGKDAPLAVVGEGFAPAMWLGLAYFAGLCVFFYRRVLKP
ncbi:OPT/YSL family transporter [Comamonas guangdongensis]